MDEVMFDGSVGEKGMGGTAERWSDLPPANDTITTVCGRCSRPYSNFSGLRHWCVVEDPHQQDRREARDDRLLAETTAGAFD